MKHRTRSEFWRVYRALLPAARRAADKQYRLMRRDHMHPSLHLKRVGGGCRRASPRTIARWPVGSPDGTFVWFWIGTYAEYNRLIRRG